MHESPPENMAEFSEAPPSPSPKGKRRATRKTLIQRVQQEGDKASWDDFYHSYKGFIIAISMKAGLNAHDAEDLMSRVFEEVHRKFCVDPDLSFDQQSFGGWLGNLVKWRIKDFYRKKQNTAEAMNDDILELLGSEKPFDKIWKAEWKKKLVEMALTRVNESPRNLLVFVDLAIKEVAVSTVCKRYDISRSNVDTIKSRVLKKLEPVILKLNKGVL
ncbi:MAG: sigma-70 family RNA polymerase sigma factor [Akkermansiaceae bacterium]|nr:sigma-70 family RNA polymerase sigma factor [Akkermansiaceae bacterium]